MASDTKSIASISDRSLSYSIRVYLNQIDILRLILNFKSGRIESFDLVALLQKPKGARIGCAQLQGKLHSIPGKYELIRVNIDVQLRAARSHTAS